MARQQTTTKHTPRTAKAAHMATALEPGEQTLAAQTPDTADREQAIREAAYACFEARGCEPGHELDDWLEAEALLQQREGGSEQVAH